MATIFLSHSADDKPAVRRLAEDLQQRGFSVWLDEWEIDIGDSIPPKVQQGLAEAKFVAVWLTPRSVISGWVEKEWQAKIVKEIGTRSATVLPLLGEDCDLPLFLADKKFADFRKSYPDGLTALIRTLSRQSPNEPAIPTMPVEQVTILSRVEGFIHDLEDASIPFPTLGKLHLIKALRTLPRSGKLLRLEGMIPPLPIRSVFDHVLSLAHSADCLLAHVRPPISGADRSDLARVITYHDLCEVILGDIPQYTSLNRTKRSLAGITAQIRLAQLPVDEPERITNQFIAMFLNDSESQSLRRSMEIMRGSSAVWKFAYALDKLDPIIGVWRYINRFRKQPGFSIDDFLTRMKHFFENPRVRTAVGKNIEDGRMLELVGKLQDPSKARQYYANASLLTDELFAFPEDVVRRLIEGRGLEFVPASGGRKRS